MHLFRACFSVSGLDRGLQDAKVRSAYAPPVTKMHNIRYFWIQHISQWFITL